MCIYALSSGLWCPLQFPHKSIFDSSFPPVVCGRAHYLCLFSYNGVHHILCCVFVLFVFAFCTLFCQCLWIVHFRLPLWYSLTFMKQNVDCYWGPTNRFNSITFLLPSHAKIWNSDAICRGLFCFQWFEVRGERRDVIVCLVDIGRIVDHHCLFSYIFQCTNITVQSISSLTRSIIEQITGTSQLTTFRQHMGQIQRWTTNVGSDPMFRYCWINVSFVHDILVRLGQMCNVLSRRLMLYGYSLRC